MVLTTVLVALSILTTAALINDMQTRPVDFVDEGYDLQEVDSIIQKTSSNKEHIELMERTLRYKEGYLSNVSYWVDNSPDHANISVQGHQSSLIGSKEVEGIDTKFKYNSTIPEAGEPVKFTDISETSDAQTYSYNNEWYVNGSQESTSSSDFTYSFSDFGNYNITLTSETDVVQDEDSEERIVRVGGLKLSIISTNSPTTFGGENIDVVSEIENLEGRDKSKTLEFEVVDSSGNLVSYDEEQVYLSPWLSEQFSFTWDPSSEGPGDYTVRVSLPNVAKENVVTVEP